MLVAKSPIAQRTYGYYRLGILATQTDPEPRKPAASRRNSTVPASRADPAMYPAARPVRLHALTGSRGGMSIGLLVVRTALFLPSLVRCSGGVPSEQDPGVAHGKEGGWVASL